MFQYLKYLYKYLSSGQITVNKRWMTMKNGVPGRQVITHRIALTTGGFIEIVQDCIPNTSYIRIHLGVPDHPQDLTETYKYVHYGTDKETVWLLRELRTALTALIDTL